jgi:hypothetical protein
MVQNISIACDATFGDGSENFGTVTGNVTFQDGSANSGTVTGNATFEGTAENKAGATITGNATFAEGTAVNNGTVSGSVTLFGPFTTWLAANAGVGQYTGVGYKNSQWAYNSTEYASEVAAQAAADEDAYQTWLAANAGVNQYSGAGSNNGKWFQNQNGPFNNKGDALDSQYNYAAWLAANTGVNQFVTADGNSVDPEATHYGQWAYNSTEYASEADARNAQYEAGFQAWLASNTGVNQYAVEARPGRFAYNSTEYPSMADAQAAYDAANPQ